MTKVYGITNCVTVQKSLKWLKDNQVDFEFHDYKKLGIDKTHLEIWCKEFGWEKVLNRAGMMWRKASESEKAKVVDQASAIEFMLQTPNSIKRPVVEYSKGLILGFNQSEWESLL